MPTITPTRRGQPTTFEYRWWSPDVVMVGTAERPIAADTETRIVQGPLDVPDVALGMAYDGRLLVLIHPDDFSAFFLAHKSQHFVFHNLAFDYWVIHDDLIRRGQKAAARLLWDIANAGRFHDTMILDQLIQLATGRYRSAFGGYGEDAKVYATGLKTLADEAGSLDLDKGDRYRLRFGELVGFTKEQMEAHQEWAGFVGYALPDAVAAYEVWPDVRSKAIDLMRKAGYRETATRYEIAPNALTKYGPLSEAIQVRGSIALAKLSRTPLPIDQASRQRMEEEARAKLKAAFETVEARNKELLQRHSLRARKYEPGSYKLCKATGLPSLSDSVLKAVLTEESHKLGIKPILSTGKTKGISTSAKEWSRHADRSPFIEAWVALEKNAKLLQFLVALDAPNVYAAYNLLMRTGRTSAASHRSKKGEKAVPSVNIQQIPRDGDFRALFIAEPGRKWVSADFGFVELCGLAATCAGRFGRSRLKEVIVSHAKHGGADPHEVMAAALMKVPIEEFKTLPKDVQKAKRQGGKACSFGYPGGLGVEKFKLYAQLNYGVTFTDEEARTAKKTWLATFTEMNDYLADSTGPALAYNLGTTLSAVRAIWPEGSSSWHDPLRRVKDTLYEAEYPLRPEDNAGLAGLVCNHRPDLQPLLEDVSKYRKLHDELFLYRACTLTGRVRGRTGYCDGANTPFQSVCSDGGKEAVWRLMYAGFEVRAFIHDEILVSVPEKTAERDVKRVSQIMVDSMMGVLGHGVPVSCDAKVGDCWQK